MNLTEEERERRRENANSLIEQGRLGGPAFGRMGGRPKKKRASELVADRVADEADAIFLKLKEIMEQGVHRDALNAALSMLKIEDKERQIEEREEMKIEQLRRDELLELVATTFRELRQSGVIEGEFVELTDREIEAARPEPSSFEA